MLEGVFVTATDTGVGKTYISCLLAASLRKKLKVGVFKPLLTGSLSDAKKLKKSSGFNMPLDVINPVFLKYPLAPYPAALIEKKSISFSSIRRCFKAIRDVCDFVIVEGAGGLYVPITKNFYMIDMIKKFNFPVVLVTRPSLGTINHTLLSIKALKAKKIRIIAVVINKYDGSDIAQKTNPHILAQLVDVPVFVVRKNSKYIPEKLIKLLIK